MNSWPTLCPCKQCLGEVYQSLVYLPPGKWLCPVSGEVVNTNLTTQDRHDKELAKCRKILGTRYRNKK